MDDGKLFRTGYSKAPASEGAESPSVVTSSQAVPVYSGELSLVASPHVLSDLGAGLS